MHTSLTTRGSDFDYGFLGSPPASLLSSEFTQLTAVERPTVLVRSTADGWAVFLSAIPTTRLDPSQRKIRISLQFDGTHDDTEAARDVLRLVDDWFAEAEPGAPLAFREALDAAFPASDVDRLGHDAGAANDTVIAERVQRALRQPRPAAATLAPVRESVSTVGDVRDADTRKAFSDFVEALLVHGRRGWAVHVNLADVESVRRHFTSRDGTVFALVDKRLPDGRLPLVPQHEERGELERPKAEQALPVPILAGAAVLVIVIIGVILWILVNRTATEEPPTPDSWFPSPSESPGSSMSSSPTGEPIAPPPPPAPNE